MARSLVAIACGLLAVVANPLPEAVAASVRDTIHLGDRTTATLDLLANDASTDGREPIVTFPAGGGVPSTNPDLGIEVGAIERGIVRLVVINAGSSGMYTFDYAVNGGAATQVKVCWGAIECDGSGSQPVIEPPGAASCATAGLCLGVPGTSTQIGAGARHHLGRGASGTHQDFRLRLINGTAAAVALNLRAAEGTRHLKFVADAGAVEQLPLSLAAGASQEFTLRAYFLPASDAAPSLGAIEAVPVGETVPTARFEFTSIGDGTVSVPGYASCGYGDVCVYSGTTKLVSIADGSRIGAYELCGASSPRTLDCPVKVGRPQDAELVAVYNGISGVDQSLPLSIGSELPLTARYDQMPATELALHAGTATVFEAVVSPRHEDVLSTSAASLIRKFRLAVPGKPAIDLPMSFRVDEPGEDCEFCRLIVAGVHYENGALIDMGSSPSGTRQTVAVELRNDGPRSANVFPRMLGSNGHFNFENLGSDVLVVPGGESAHFGITAQHMPGVLNARLELVRPAAGGGSGERIYSGYELKSTGIGSLPTHELYESACSSTVYKFCVFVGEKSIELFSAQRRDGTLTSPAGMARVYDFGNDLLANEWVTVPLTLVNYAGSGISTAAVVPVHGPIRILDEQDHLLCERNPLADAAVDNADQCGSVTVSPTTTVSVRKLKLSYRWLPLAGSRSSRPDFAKVVVRTQGLGSLGHEIGFVANCDTQRVGFANGCSFTNGVGGHTFELSDPAQPSDLGAKVGSERSHRIAHVVMPRPGQGGVLSSPPVLRMDLTERLFNQAGNTFPTFWFEGTANAMVETIAPAAFAPSPYLVEQGFVLRVAPGTAVGAYTGMNLTTTLRQSVEQPIPGGWGQSAGVYAEAPTQGSRFNGCPEAKLCLYRTAGPRRDATWVSPMYLTFDNARYVGALGAIANQPPGPQGSVVSKQYTVGKGVLFELGGTYPYEEVHPWTLANNSDRMVAVELSVDESSEGFGVGRERYPAAPASSPSGWSPMLRDVFFIRPRQHVAVPVWLKAFDYETRATLRITQLDASGAAYPGHSAYLSLRNRPSSANPDCRELCVDIAGALRRTGENVVLNLPPGAVHRAPVRIVNGTNTEQPLVLTLLDSEGFRSTKGYVGLEGTGCERVGVATSRCVDTLGPREERAYTFIASGLRYPEDFGLRVTLGEQSAQFGVQVRIVP